VLVTNFGLIITEDGGANWAWSCERDVNAFGAFYQQSASRQRLFAVANDALIFSDDFTCGWATGGGLLSGQVVLDAFVDRTVPDRVLALGSHCCEGDQPVYAAFESLDAGGTFERALYQAAPGTIITGVESATSDPGTIYLTLASGAGAAQVPLLARSTDGGSTFVEADLSAALGPGSVRLVAVDPEDASRVWLLHTDATSQELALTRDGGATAAIVLAPAGVMKSVLRTSTGSILVAVDQSGQPALFRSQDRGETFQAVFNPPHLRALAERAGVVYAATDDVLDQHAIAVSSDDGTTWRGILRYADTRGIVGCLKEACQATCANEAALGLWPAAMCNAAAPAFRVDTDGGGDAEGAPDAGDDSERVAVEASSDDSGNEATGAAGCGCATAGASSVRDVGWLTLLAMIVGFASRKRRRALVIRRARPPSGL
jgi:MYXO-CTERM domain-containing protein